MTEAAWKRRFRAPRFTFPQWARDRPDRIIYGANHEGAFEVYALDLSTGVERRLTTRTEGTGYRVPARIDPHGDEVWWWDDEGGSELGVWRAQPFAAAVRASRGRAGGLPVGRRAALRDVAQRARRRAEPRGPDPRSGRRRGRRALG